MRISPAEALERLGGMATGADLRRIFSPRELREAVLAGSVIRQRRDLYALPGADAARSAALRTGGVISHLSAAQVWGWKLRLPPRAPQVTVPRWRSLPAQRRGDAEVHWHNLPEHHIDGLLTSRVRTVLDCIRTLPLPDALSVADSALRSRQVDVASLQTALSELPRTGRVRAGMVLDLADPRSANPFESSLRAIAHGVPGLTVEPQHLIPWVGRVDLADPRLRLALEADSHAFHGGPGTFRYDVRRYTAIVRAGWTLLRFCWEDVIHQPRYVELVLADLVARGPDLRPVRISAHDRRL